MYERSATVLEKYFSEIFGLDKKINLRTIFENYKELVEETQKYQDMITEEEEIINDFDDVANSIRIIQQEQKKLYQSNLKLEEERNQLFNSLDQEPEDIERALKKIEETIDINNDKLEELRESFIVSFKDFTNKQKQRNQQSRNRRVQEKNHLQIIEKMTKDLAEIEVSTLRRIKDFINTEEEEEIIDIMIENGKDERVPFNYQVMSDAVMQRKEIAKKEAESYILIYERSKRVLGEIAREELKIDKYTKILRDVSVKLSFLGAEKNYIVSFLDNERMTAINGKKNHDQLMSEACKDFETDIEQINNLYKLIMKEIANKSSKKSYSELYNKDYLKNMNKKIRNFEQEVNGINIKTGTIINPNYWRIDEIRNIYDVFQKEVSEKFEKDLSEYKLEDIEQEQEILQPQDNIFGIYEGAYVKDEYDDEDDIDSPYSDYNKPQNTDNEYGEYEDSEYENEEGTEFDIYKESGIIEENLENSDDKYDEYDDDYKDIVEENDSYNEYSEYDEYDDEYEEFEDDDEYDEYEEFEDEKDYDDYNKEEISTSKDNKKGKGLLNKFFK
ncbi:MAG: hypothetical protein HFJ59_05405 [Clostridia bacterium]|nr:hypothetical protein [Clostridia bacterium]